MVPELEGYVQSRRASNFSNYNFIVLRMGKMYSEITSELSEWISQQKVFFVGTAAADGLINVSPKGLDTLRIQDRNKLLWLNLTGSGNETAAHLLESDRITIMFCAFEGKPLILRIYGHARIIQENHKEWDILLKHFPVTSGARQIIEITTDKVQTSCGFGVPLMDFQGERDMLTKWSDSKGDDGIHDYWKEKNSTSLDGKPTGIPIK